MNEKELKLNRHEKAEMLDQRILTSCTLVQKNLLDMCKDLKEMRDDKLYKELGYSEFNDYTQEKLGMSDRNVYRYISVAEKVAPDLVTTLSLNGISKLNLLTTLSDEKQHEIAEKIDLEAVSVRQLREEINKLKGENMKAQNEREKITAKLDAEVAMAEEAREELEMVKRKLRQQEIKSAAEMDRANRTAVKLHDQQRENARLEKENKELRERPVEVAVEDHTEEYEKKLAAAIEKERRKNDAQTAELQKDFHARFTALREEYEDKLKETQESADEDKDKQEFKVFLVMAHDALTRLTAIANTHADEPVYAEKLRGLLEKFSKMLEA